METMETISLKIKNLEERLDKQDIKNNDIFVKIDTKISREEFTWIIGLLVAILIGLFGYISWQISQVQSDQSQVKNQVSYIDGVFKNYDLKINN